MENKNFGGRPKREPEEGERVHLGFRVTPVMKAKIEAAAKASGRSISQEAELRLERSFEHQALLPEATSLAYEAQLAGVLMTLGLAMRNAGPQTTRLSNLTSNQARDWLDDPYGYDQAVKAAMIVLERFRPAGEPVAPFAFSALAQLPSTHPGAAELRNVDKNLGVIEANTVLAAVAGQGTTKSLEDQVADIRRLIGPICKRLRGKAPRGNVHAPRGKPSLEGGR